MIHRLIALAVATATLCACAARGAENQVLTYAEVRGVIDRAAWIDLSAYTLVPESDIVKALGAKARAHRPVQVLLTGDGFDYALRQNRQTAEILRAAGAKVELAQYPLHMKLLVTPSVAIVTDTNFTRRGIYLVLPTYARKTAVDALQGQTGYVGGFTTAKGLSLQVEAALISGSSDAVTLGTESFGSHNPVYEALEGALTQHRSVTITVNAHDLSGNDAEESALAGLREHGARIQTSDAADKYALVGGSCWWGSSNASPGLTEQVDFGLRIDDASLCRTLVWRLHR